MAKCYPRSDHKKKLSSCATANNGRHTEPRAADELSQVHGRVGSEESQPFGASLGWPQLSFGRAMPEWTVGDADFCVCC